MSLTRGGKSQGEASAAKKIQQSTFKVIETSSHLHLQI